MPILHRTKGIIDALTYKISYKNVGKPTFLYDKKPTFYIDICIRK